ncbi:MAG: HEAT repeat domain-containing protein [Candidatus Eremiobacteraeota bacterium]|nr:HEAT repeat domain-containing protein [Candidatus Eremiobacteraeota bacterium]
MKSNTIREKFEQILLVCRAEWGSLLWMILLNFILISGSVIALSVLNAIFIHRVGFEKLPVMFIITALVMIPYFTIYNFMESHINRRSVLSGSFLAYSLLIIMASFVLLTHPRNHFVISALYIIGTCILLLINVQYWSFVNLIFHPRQGKRLFPLLGIGGTLGAIIMGFSLRSLAEAMGTLNLLFLWSATLAFAAIMIFFVYKYTRVPEEYKSRSKLHFKGTVTQSFEVMKSLPILKTMAGIIFVMSFVSFIIYFQFIQAVQVYMTRGPTFEIEFTGFVGSFNGMLYLAILLFHQAFLAGRVVNRLGVVSSLYLQPILLALPILVGIINPRSPVYPLAGRFIDHLCQSTFYKTATESIYGSIPGWKREYVMSFMKMIITPLSIGFSGLVLMGIVWWFPGSFLGIVNFILPFALIIWVLLIWKMKDLYVETLFNNFTGGGEKERLESYLALSQLRSATTLDLLRRTMQRGSARMKKFALELAGEMKITILRDDVLEFLDSKNDMIKIASIDALGKIGGKYLFSELMRIYKDQSEKVKLHILRTLEEISPDLFEINAPFLLAEEKSDLIAGYLIEQIIKNRPLTVEQEHRLVTLFDSDEEGARAHAAICLSWDKKGKFKTALLKLLNDQSVQVQKAAAISTGELKYEEAVPILIKLLYSKCENVCAEVIRSFSKLKTGVANQVIISINENDPPDILEKKFSVIAGFYDKEQRLFLIENSGKFIPEVISTPLEIFARNFPAHIKLDKNEQKVIQDMIERKEFEINEYLRCAVSLRGNEDDNVLNLFELLIEERINHLKKITLIGLHLLNPTERILTIMENIFSGDVRKKNIAVEALENILTVAYKKDIMPFFEKDTFKEELDVYSRSDGFKLLTIDEIISIINQNPDSWLRAWTFYAAGKMGIAGYKPEIEKYTNSGESILSEHARFALGLLS